MNNGCNNILFEVVKIEIKDERSQNNNAAIPRRRRNRKFKEKFKGENAYCIDLVFSRKIEIYDCHLMGSYISILSVFIEEHLVKEPQQKQKTDTPLEEIVIEHNDNDIYEV